ncbi:MAG: D-glycero-beta-D-manno-heptose-7-phosphate kinase [Candidatus Aminicenantes bacterium]
MKKRDTQKTAKIVQNFASRRVLVLGDLMMDKYIWGDVSRISPEAPVPVVEVRKDTRCLGGAGNVGHNLETLGAHPLLVGVVGEDEEGQWIKENVAESSGIFVDKKRPTIVKTRIIAHQQQVVRVDWEKKNPVSSRTAEEIFRLIQQKDYDGILISDYNKGLLTRSLMNKVLPFAQKKKIPIFVDPKIDNFFLFSPVTLITPNHYEAEKIVRHPCSSDSQVENAGEKILSRINSRYLILKRGEQGMSVFAKGKKPYHIPTTAREVYDVTGAGDTVIAVAALALLSGASIQEAAILANTAAGIVVGKLGTATLTSEELINSLNIMI